MNKDKYSNPITNGLKSYFNASEIRIQHMGEANGILSSEISEMIIEKKIKINDISPKELKKIVRAYFHNRIISQLFQLTKPSAQKGILGLASVSVKINSKKESYFFFPIKMTEINRSKSELDKKGNSYLKSAELKKIVQQKILNQIENKNHKENKLISNKTEVKA